MQKVPSPKSRFRRAAEITGTVSAFGRIASAPSAPRPPQPFGRTVSAPSAPQPPETSGLGFGGPHSRHPSGSTAGPSALQGQDPGAEDQKSFADKFRSAVTAISISKMIIRNQSQPNSTRKDYKAPAPNPKRPQSASLPPIDQPAPVRKALPEVVDPEEHTSPLQPWGEHNPNLQLQFGRAASCPVHKESASGRQPLEESGDSDSERETEFLNTVTLEDIAALLQSGSNASTAKEGPSESLGQLASTSLLARRLFKRLKRDPSILLNKLPPKITDMQGQIKASQELLQQYVENFLLEQWTPTARVLNLNRKSPTTRSPISRKNKSLRGKDRISSEMLQEGLKAITPKSALNNAKRRSGSQLTRRYLPGIGTRFCKVKKGVVVQVVKSPANGQNLTTTPDNHSASASPEYPAIAGVGSGVGKSLGSGGEPNPSTLKPLGAKVLGPQSVSFASGIFPYPKP